MKRRIEHKGRLHPIYDFAMAKFPMHLLMLTMVLFLISGCNLYPQDSYKTQYVVEAYLTARQHLPDVRVSRTVPANAVYSYDKSAVNAAEVEVRLLSGNGNIVQHYPYLRVGPGIYAPNTDVDVQPLHKYQLYVHIDSTGQVITSTTVVPDTFRHVSNVPDSIVYQSPNLLTIRTTLSHYPGRQNIYIFSVLASDTSLSNLTPFYAYRVTNNSDVQASEFVKNSSGIVNQGNYKINSDSTITLTIPWLAFAFYGKNTIVTNAIDDNLYDFLRSQNVQTGGSTLPPGVIPNLIYHVKGGIGIFGSMANDTVRLYLKKK